MASDFGDESGEKLFDFMVRFGERMGEDAMRRHANKLQTAFENAKSGTQVEPRDTDGAVEWAKLDMHEFQEIEGYDEIKLKATGVEPASEQLKKDLDEKRDSRPLEEKAKEAREAADALEREVGKSRQRVRDPRFQETRAR